MRFIANVTQNTLGEREYKKGRKLGNISFTIAARILRYLEVKQKLECVNPCGGNSVSILDKYP